MKLGDGLVPAIAMLIVFLAEPAAARSSSTDPVAAICVEAAQRASRHTGVPLNILIALTMTETGRQVNETFVAWPWAINQNGKSQWLSSYEETISVISAAIGEGRTNIDIGCFQLNYRWHAASFPSIEAMLDPFNNALYAAQMVLDFKNSNGDWMQAVSSFHSRTPDVAKIYISKFKKIYFSLENPELLSKNTNRSERKNNFPLLQLSGLKSPGSIVPLAVKNRPTKGEH